jgi:hypothetical protein
MALLQNAVIAFLAIVTLMNPLDAFQIIKSSRSPQGPVKVGSTVELTCQTDENYEYCDWWIGDFTREKECRFEWKRSHGAVKQQKCDTLKDRMQFIGKNDECKVVLSNP